MKRFIYLLIAGLAVMGSQRATAQSTGTFDYNGYLNLGSFEWTDDGGTKHTSTYTDVATDPNHIMQLVGNAYINVAVPGIWKGGYTANDVREGDAFYGNIGGWNLSGTKPNTEGYTTFLVQVKDDWTGQSYDDDNKVNTRALTKDYINRAIKSVSLLYDRVIVGGSNPGVLYKLPTGELSRFYMMSKGRARRPSDATIDVRKRAPFKAMYEEYAPVAAGIQGSGLTDFYSKLLAGDVYSVVHDCLSVSSTGHYFCMTGQNSTEARQVSNLLFFLPDKRLKYWDGRIDPDDNTKDEYQCYNPDYAPKMGTYAVKLNASAAPSTTSGKYTVTLNWSSTLAEMLGKGVVKEAFHLYVVQSDSVGETLAELPLADSTATTYSYDVPIETAGRVITYRVSGYPFDEVTFLSKTWSNDDAVEIPGTDAHVRLAIKGKTSSEYVQDKEWNQYRNTLTMDNAIGNRMYAADVNADDKFRFTRVGGSHSGTCATVTITAKDDTCFSYSVEYAKQDGAIESLYPAKTGTFGVNDDGSVDFRGFSICDQFQDHTHENKQAASYSYRVMYSPTTGTSGDSYYSNWVAFKVYKTSSAMTNSVTEAAAKADVDHSLTFTEVPQIQFSVEKNLNIRQYTVIRDNTTIGRAQGNNQDALSVFELYNSGMKWVRNSESPVTVNDNTYGFKDYAYYVPVIVVNDNDTVNTYGCDIKRGYAAKVTVTEEGKLMSTYKLRDASGKDLGARYFETTLKVKATVPYGLDVEAYRMWRDCGDKAVEESDEYAWRKNPLTPWFNGFESVSQEKKDVYLISGGTAQSEELTINDVFGAKLPTATDPLEVNYIVRLYCVDDSGKYYVAESTVPVTYNYDTPTGVNGVISDNADSFSVTPSIASSQVTVSGCDGAVVVRSTTGAVVMSLNGNGESVRTLSVDGLAPGCYIVTSGSHSQRIIKK